MPTYTIPIILGTTRKDNQSSKVANYLLNQLSNIDAVETRLLDLGRSDFPLLVDRVTPENQITPLLEEWTKILREANGVIIVAPEYKSGYPGSLKNFLDYLPPGIFRYKPIGISTVSSGIYAGTSCLQQLRQVVIGMAGMIVPDRFQVGNVQTAFNADIELVDDKQIKIAKKFISEVIKYTSVFTTIQNT